MQKLNKKGAFGLGQLAGIVTILVIISVMLFVGVKTNSEIAKDLDDTTITVTLTNETTTNVNDSGSQAFLVNYPGLNFRSCEMAANCVNNATGAVDIDGAPNCIPAGNYTISGCGIVFSGEAGDAPQHNDTTWNITGTFTYKSDTVKYNASQSSDDGVVSVAEQQGLLGTVIIFGVIITTVIVAFAINGGTF